MSSMTALLILVCLLQIFWIMRLHHKIKRQSMADKLLAESEFQFQSLVESIPNVSVQGYDRDRRVVYWNKASEQLYGYCKEEVLGQTLENIIIPDAMKKAVVHNVNTWMNNGAAIPAAELTLQKKDGQPIDVYSSHVMQFDRHGNPIMYCLDIDLTEQKQAEMLALKQANYDSLTALPNRNMFNDRLEQEIKKAKRSRNPLALLFLDLDKFKEVNDTFGHPVGDKLLIDASYRIRQCIRETDTVARLGGDEFTVILPDLNDIHRIEHIASAIIASLSQPFKIDNETIYVSASIGITVYPNDADNVNDLLKNVDQAMYFAKDSGRSRFSYFTRQMQQSALERFNLTNDLRNALDGNQFELYYQPIVDLATGDIHKAEALLRWNHPERGWVSPADFIPLAEDSGLINEIGSWVFQQASRQAVSCQQYRADFQISINVSPVQFRGDHDWHTMVSQAYFSGSNVVVEITEGLLMEDNELIAQQLLGFRDAGIQVAIDDFGTGYSSLSYLNKFDIDYLKIDQSFIRHLSSNSHEMALSEAIIVMAHKLGLKVIAEGVETELQRDLLIDAGCDYVQGYLFSKPLPVDAFVKLLQA